MLTIAGRGGRYCDGLSRRNFMQVGALVSGGLTLPGLLADQKQRFRAVIDGNDGALYAITDEGRLYRIGKK